MAQHRHHRSNGTNGQCELVGIAVSEAMRDDGTVDLQWIFDEGGTGRCVLTQQTHGYECAHCGSLLAIHSHGVVVERVG